MTQTTGNFHALVIGVGVYDSPRFPDLPVTVNDAMAVSAVLRDPRTCGYPDTNVRTLVLEQSTRDNILAALRDLARGSALSETTLVYFSGHGGRGYADGMEQAYLCPRGADVSNLKDTAISAGEFSKALTAIAGQRLVVILDMCFASGAADLKSAIPEGMWKTGWSDIEYEALSQGSGRVVIASSKEGQVSYVRRQGDMSVFTYHLIQALRGKAAIRNDGLVHVLDVYDYVSEAVRREMPSQEPVLKVPSLDRNFPLALATEHQPSQGTPESPSQQDAQTAPAHEAMQMHHGVNEVRGDGNTIVVSEHATLNFGQPRSPSRD